MTASLRKPLLFARTFYSDNNIFIVSNPKWSLRTRYSRRSPFPLLLMHPNHNFGRVFCCPAEAPQYINWTLSPSFASY